MTKPVVICYETGGIYKQSADVLVASGAAHGCEILVYTRADLGAWWANVTHKPDIIGKTLNAGSAPVLYLDADCRLLAPVAPVVSYLEQFDVLIRHRGEGAKEPYNGGVMLLANTPAVKKFVADWTALVHKYGHRYETCDQKFIAEAAKDIRIGKLPLEYNVLPSDTCPSPIITHSKISRTDPALSSWKECRRLERVLLDRMRTHLSGNLQRLLLWGGESTLPAVTIGAELHVVDRYDKAAKVSAAWFSSVESLVEADDTQLSCPRMIATDFAKENVAAYLRTRTPKPSGESPPPYLHAFYPSFDASTSFNRGELCGPNPWTAALNAAALRGCRQAVVSCPDGMRPLCADACNALNIRLTLE